MSREDRRSEWSIIIGIGLLALGVSLLFQRVLGPLWSPFWHVLGFMSQIGGPLVLIAIGILIITRGRRGGAWQTGGRRMFRSRTNRMIGGVLAGFAERYNADVTLVRVLYVVLTILTGIWPGFVIYMIALAIIPEAPWTATGVQGPRPAPPVPPTGTWSATTTQTPQAPTPTPPGSTPQAPTPPASTPPAASTPSAAAPSAEPAEPAAPTSPAPPASPEQ